MCGEHSQNVESELVTSCHLNQVHLSKQYPPIINLLIIFLGVIPNHLLCMRVNSQIPTLRTTGYIAEVDFRVWETLKQKVSE
jgi:hypothetical protein